MKTLSVIVDLDGTLANIDHRAHFVKRDKPLWDEFYSACDQDTPNLWCAAVMTALGAHYNVYIVSARRDTEEGKTLKWLNKHSVYFDGLFMLRKGSDSTADTVLKKEWLNNFGRENILFVIDDRQKVVDMWRREGVVCLQCYAWAEYVRKPT